MTLDKNATEYFYKSTARQRFGRDRGFLPFEVNAISKLLEVGCGSTFSAKPTELAVGVDASLPLLNTGKLLHPEGEFVRADARYLPLKSDIFDAVISRDLLHHVVGSNPQLSIENIRRAIGEMERVRSTRGNIFLAEHCIFLRLGALLVYIFCKLLIKLNMEVSLFSYTPRLVVHFLTLKQLTGILATCDLESYIVRKSPWRIMRVPIGEFVVITAR